MAINISIDPRQTHTLGCDWNSICAEALGSANYNSTFKAPSCLWHSRGFARQSPIRSPRDLKSWKRRKTDRKKPCQCCQPSKGCFFRHLSKEEPDGKIREKKKTGWKAGQHALCHVSTRNPISPWKHPLLLPAVCFELESLFVFQVFSSSMSHLELDIPNVCVSHTWTWIALPGTLNGCPSIFDDPF